MTEDFYYQLIDAVEVYETIPGSQEQLQILLHIGKKRDGTVIYNSLSGLSHDVFLAVNDNYTIERAQLLAKKLNEHLLKNQHFCKRYQCSTCKNNGEDGDDENAHTICTEACKLIRVHDKVACRGATLVQSKGFYGFEPKKRKFVKFLLTRSYYNNYVLRKFFAQIPDAFTLLNGGVNGGVYESNSNLVESYFNRNRGYGGFDWYDMRTGKPVPPQDAPASTVIVPLKTLVFDIETPSPFKKFPRPEDGIPVGTFAWEFYPERKKFCFMTRGLETADVDIPPHRQDVELTVFNTEREMLLAFQRKFMEFDPDFVAGYNSNHFDVPYMMKRMKILGMEEWNRWSRVSSEPVRLLYTQFHSEQKGTRERTLVYCPGRIFLDVFIKVEEDITIKIPSKKLGNVGKYLKLGVKTDMPIEQLHPSFNGNAGARGKVMDYNVGDVDLTGAIMVKKKMVESVVANCRVFKILGRDETNRGINYKLNRLVYSRTYGTYLRPYVGYVNVKNVETGLMESVKDVPEKFKSVKAEMDARASPLEGGFVFKVKEAGHFGRWIAVLDFNSLYPSLIRRHNICHSTWIRSHEEAALFGLVFKVDYDEAPNGALFLCREKHMGFFPEMSAFLVDERTKIRDAAKLEPDLTVRSTLESIANSYKIAANSLYGAFGMRVSPLSLMLGGGGITSHGRTYIVKVMDYIHTAPDLQRYNPRVRYGDTDSCMVQFDAPNLEEARRIFIEMQYSVNVKSGLLQAPMKVGRDSLNYSLTLLAAKMYIRSEVDPEPGASDEAKPVAKGVQFIKGDSVPYVRDVSTTLLRALAVENWTKEQVKMFMERAIQDLLLGEVDRSMFMMTQRLSKPLVEYANAAGLGHVTAAHQLEKAGRLVSAGDAIDYFFCHTGREDGSVGSAVVACDLVGKLELNWSMYVKRFVSPFVDLLGIVLGPVEAQQVFNVAKYWQRKVVVSDTFCGETNRNVSMIKGQTGTFIPKTPAAAAAPAGETTLTTMLNIQIDPEKLAKKRALHEAEVARKKQKKKKPKKKEVKKPFELEEHLNS